MNLEFSHSSPINVVSHSTGYLAELQQRIPIVGDRALVNIVNGIQVSNDVIRYRKSLGYFGQLMSSLDGSDRSRQLLLNGNLIAGQEALRQWVLELSDSLRISQVALEVTQQSLLEARNAIRRYRQLSQDHQEAVSLLAQQLNCLAQQVGDRLNQLEARVRQLEVRVAANEDLAQIVTAWTAGQSYTNLPWAVQVVLLAREVFSSAVAVYELETGDTHRFRSLLINKLLSMSQQLPQSFFSLADLLDHAWSAMSKSDRALTAALLEIRSLPPQRLLNAPMLFTIGTTLELATLPESSRPSKPGQSAIALCRTQVDSICRTTDAREFVTAIVEETANDCLNLLRWH
ncbi:MAG: diguanylate cyclase regulator RdcB family protein [Cyanophyceae cyanobacterium]